MDDERDEIPLRVRAVGRAGSPSRFRVVADDDRKLKIEVEIVVIVRHDQAPDPKAPGGGTTDGSEYRG